LPDRKAALPPRPGRLRASTPPHAKARGFPPGAPRSRLLQMLWPPNLDTPIAFWLSTRPSAPTGAELGCENPTPTC